ncbi:MAG: cytochrome c3 family protein [Planctomycetes bacterium]|nr:cytochrome c3 family protein [Planctomycetota bacterium]
MAMFLLLASCDEVERHKTLTFFFDGVPPLRTEAPEAQAAGLIDNRAADKAPVGLWRTHAPVKNCTVCHGEQRRAGAARKVQLVAEVPQLCYNCHKEFSALQAWVHGPVATGNCLLCHEPHKAKNESLLRKPVPDLCYQCHEEQAIRQIKNHAEASYARCIDCHEGHASAARGLLRQTFLDQPAGREYRSEAYRRSYEEALRRARSDLTQGQDFLALSGTALDYLERGQWWPARAYLEILLGSDLPAETEKLALTEILRQVEALQAGEPNQSPPDVPTQTATDSAVAAEGPAGALRAVRERRSEQAKDIAELYYRSIKLYHAGQVAEAREGFRQVLADHFIPGPMKETARTYLEQIEGNLAPPGQPDEGAMK